MKKLSQKSILVISLLFTILWRPVIAYSDDKAPEFQVPEGVYIKLTREFYESLREEGQGRTKTYSNNPSIEYLKQISISTRFMVETNLQIMKQQERILQLLHSLLENRKK